MAANFGTSRGPIRAALNKLEEEGLVTNVPRKGSFITPLDKKLVADIYGVRSVLEGYGIRLAIPNLSVNDMEELERLFLEMQEAAKNNDLEKVLLLDLATHQFYIQKSGNKILQQNWFFLKVQVRRILSFRYFSHPYLEEMADSHVLLLEMTRKKNIDLAAKIMQEHISEACDDILSNWEHKKFVIDEE